jgi:hypothetical protein
VLNPLSTAVTGGLFFVEQSSRTTGMVGAQLLVPLAG